MVVVVLTRGRDDDAHECNLISVAEHLGVKLPASPATGSDLRNLNCPKGQLERRSMITGTSNQHCTSGTVWTTHLSLHTTMSTTLSTQEYDELQLCGIGCLHSLHQRNLLDLHNKDIEHHVEEQHLVNAFA